MQKMRKFPIYDILEPEKKRIAEKNLRWQPKNTLIEVFNVMLREDVK